MFDIENIYLDVSVKNTKELFEKMNKIFLDKAYVKEGYLESLIKREENYPTGLQFNGYQVAIPHTDPKFINEEKIVFVRLKEDIKFGEMGSDSGYVDVKVVLMLLINKGEKQVDILLNLMKLFENKDNYLLLEKSENKEEILNLLIQKF